jgi:hypothetical protein
MSKTKLKYVKNQTDRRVIVTNVSIRVRIPCVDGTEYEVWQAPVVDFSEATQLLDLGCPEEWVTAAMLKAVKGAKDCTVKRFFIPAH